MSEILETLKKDLLKNRKEQNKQNVTIISTLIGEVQTISSRDRNKTITDQDIIRIIDKSIEALQERLKHRPSSELEHEIELLSQYVPEKLSEEELIRIKEDNGFSSAKEMLPYLKANYDGLYDGKLAAKVANSR